MSTSSAPRPRSLDPLIGATLLDRYRIEKMIGRGGMGLVYLAEQIDAQRMVVIKLLAPQWLDDGMAVTRFAREGKRLQQLAHPNVVQLLECGHADDQGFIAMEYLDGEPLRRFLGRRGRLSLQEFTPIATQILSAVGYAHDRNIMLRDIKPANIMLCERDGRANFVKLLDFGLAKLVDGDDEEVTKSHVIGTAGYLAPEQIKGEPADLRVDVYAIGVLFYLMLAGESPIVGENDGALLYNHVHGTPKPLGEHLPDGHNVPELLIALVHQCLEKDPARRPADANEVAEALFECVPPKLFALPKADEDSRRAMREYRDARDRGLEHEGPVSSEWTKPVVRTALEASPADLSAASLPQPRSLRRPTPSQRPPELPPVRRPSSPGVPQPIADRTGARGSAGVPQPIADRTGSRASLRRPTPLPAGDAPPRGRAAAIGGRSSDAALRTDDGVVRSDAPDARVAEGSRRLPPLPPRRATPVPPPVARVRSQLEAPRDEAAIESPIVLPHEPEIGPMLPIAEPGTGRLLGERDSAPLRIGSALPVQRRVLVAIGALAIAAGALAAWAIFMPASSSTTPIAAAAAGPTSAAQDPAPSKPSAAPAPTSTSSATATSMPTATPASDPTPVVVAAPEPSSEPRASATVVGKPGKKKGKGVRAEDLPKPPTDEAEAEDEEVVEPAPLPDKPDPVPPALLPKKPPPPPPAPDPKRDDDPFLPTTPKPTSDPLLPPG